jgi:hypothetical protein
MQWRDLILNLAFLAFFAYIAVVAGAHVLRPERYVRKSPLSRGGHTRWTIATVRWVGGFYLIFSLPALVVGAIIFSRHWFTVK